MLRNSHCRENRRKKQSEKKECNGKKGKTNFRVEGFSSFFTSRFILRFFRVQCMAGQANYVMYDNNHKLLQTIYVIYAMWCKSDPRGSEPARKYARKKLYFMFRSVFGVRKLLRVAKK